MVIPFSVLFFWFGVSLGAGKACGSCHTLPLLWNRFWRKRVADRPIPEPPAFYVCKAAVCRFHCNCTSLCKEEKRMVTLVGVDLLESIHLIGEQG